MSVFAHCLFWTPGTGGFVTGRNAQNSRSFAVTVMVAAVGRAAVADFGHGAPMRIQLVNTLIWSAVSFAFGGIRGSDVY